MINALNDDVLLGNHQPITIIYYNLIFTEAFQLGHCGDYRTVHNVNIKLNYLLSIKSFYLGHFDDYQTIHNMDDKLDLRQLHILG